MREERIMCKETTKRHYKAEARGMRLVCETPCPVMLNIMIGGDQCTGHVPEKYREKFPPCPYFVEDLDEKRQGKIVICAGKTPAEQEQSE